ncbi:MAG: ATP-grasp domain-containing protein [Gammaproteobacteria bacterium]|nr:ATP-grasp domain-containing protein [Gammaproteobacteria bacterium]
MSRRRNDLTRAVVLSCKGAAEGDLNVVRSLGREGVPITVIAEYDGAPAARSRYCDEHILLPRFTRNPEILQNFLIDYARQQTDRPVLIPTADPDLLLVSALRTEIEPFYHLPLASAALVDVLTDKRKFASFAVEHGMPVPATHTPLDKDQLYRVLPTLEYPVVVKPSHPQAWPADVFEHLGDNKKALILPNDSALHQACAELFERNLPFLIQEYIPGGDEEHYELHVYLDASSTPRAWFCGQKVRIWPPHAGSGCYVESRYIELMVDAGLQLLREIGFTGLANLDFKRHPISGEFKLLEINPRVSQWNILGSACGVNLPYLAYCHATGHKLPSFARQREGTRYVNLKNDLKAFRCYRRTGEWTLARYLRSLLHISNVHQYFAVDDLRPFVHELRGSITGLARRLWSRLR